MSFRGRSCLILVLFWVGSVTASVDEKTPSVASESLLDAVNAVFVKAREHFSNVNSAQDEAVPLKAVNETQSPAAAKVADQIPVSLRPVEMSPLAKTMLFLLRSLALNDATSVGIRGETRMLVSEDAAANLVQTLESELKENFVLRDQRREGFNKIVNTKYSRSFTYDSGNGAIRGLTLRIGDAFDETARTGTGNRVEGFRVLEMRSDDPVMNLALDKIKLRLSDELAEVIFDKDDFLMRKKEMLRSAEKDAANEGIPAREILNFVELLHLGMSDSMDFFVVESNRVSYRLRFVGARGELAEALVSVDRNLRIMNSQEDVVHEFAGAQRLIEVEVHSDHARLTETQQPSSLKLLKEVLGKLDQERIKDESHFRRLLEGGSIDAARPFSIN